jgi:hypothetical protein
MTMAKRRMTDLRGDPTQLVIDSAPDDMERKKAQQAYRLNAVQIPTWHILGFCLRTICSFFHNLFTLKPFSWSSFFETAALVMSYSPISWLILYSWLEKAKKFAVSFLFLVLNVFKWILMICFSGGEKSFLFWLMVMRVAHQINTSFK